MELFALLIVQGWVNCEAQVNVGLPPTSAAMVIVAAMAVRDLLDEALRLPPSERGRLVHDLIKSLEDSEHEDPVAVDQAWAEELDRRATRALSGETNGRSLDAVCDELEAKRHQKT
jgi:putative addiction module component (TIGR02574 family)